MKKSLPTILILSTLILSCEKYDIPKNYPTTFNKLSSATISQMRSSYALRNHYVSTSINDFGFCDLIGDPLNVGTPPLQNAISKSEAIDIVKTFVSLNGDVTGVKNPQDLAFSQTSTTTGYGGAIGWHFRTANQKVDTIEVLYSEILIHLTNSAVTLCYGNWYPGIFIPYEFNVSQTKAVASLNGKVVSHYLFGGTEYHVTISQADLDNSTIGLKILPIEKEDKIELRVCWQINIPVPVYYIMYVDVMTGEIIGQEPTIIS
jgi:Zn-dependent metalloprotease